ncbi:hypothetical protein ACTMTI_35220 [Nonomuraea sp. H19]|uniref:hypothetical protein n=1 Tax=Nonomuraea sp. H19 TaxID=3452206 RepID=UPI003F89EA65
MKTKVVDQIMRSRLVNRVRRGKSSGDLRADSSAIAPPQSLLLTAVCAPIVLVVTAAVLIRVAVMLGYQRAFWYGDSADYVHHALQIVPNPIRPLGYSAFLRMLLPFHSNVLVAATQHAMGIGIGILVYVLLRRWQVRPMLAVVAALPVLFDARQLGLEHSLLSETLFTGCLIGAVAAALWRHRPTAPTAALAGVLLGAATLTRSIALPLVALYLLILLVQRARLRTLLVAMASCLAPLFAYGLWFQAHHGAFAVTTSDGLILWSRTMSFADCAKIRPPADLVPLCPPESLRAIDAWPGVYITRPNAWLYATEGHPFSPDNNSLARQFALRAIVAQPVDYALTVARDLATHIFLMGHPPAAFLTAGSGGEGVPPQAMDIAATYGYGGAPAEIPAFTRFLEWYEHRIYLSGPVLLALIAIPVVFALRYKRLPVRLLLPWTAAVALVVLATGMNQADYRYVQPAIPLACVAMAYAVARAKALRTAPTSRTTPGTRTHAEATS